MLRMIMAPYRKVDTLISMVNPCFLFCINIGITIASLIDI